MNETDFWKRFEMISHKSHALPFDYTLCRDASLSDIDMGAVTSLFQRERIQQQPWFYSTMGNEELLEHLRLLQGGILTYGAVLCFGKNPSQWVAEAFTRCISYKGNERLDGWEEDQEFRGSLLEQYESSMAFLQKNLRLSRVISAGGSVEQWEIPLVVLREALANALIHREYADQRNSVRVEIFNNRIEISSPGALSGSLTIEQLGLEDQHYPLRNPHIAYMFYLCNYVEKLGTGIARMRKELQKAQLSEPQFDPNNGRSFKVILRRPQHVELHNAETKSTSKVVTTEADLADFLQRFEETSRSSHRLPFDHTLCRTASLSDIDLEAVARFCQKKRVQEQQDFHSNMTERELLEHFGLLREGIPTYGAVLCFGKNPSRWVIGAFTRCISYKGDDPLDDWEEDREFRGSLLEQYESSIKFLQKHLRLSAVISAAESVEQKREIPLVVLQEALANALIHREYADQANSIRVEIFNNRVEISSPGSLPDGLTISQLGRATDYPTRNPQIARIFYLCHYVETLGRGIARMQREMRNAHLPQPQFDTTNGRTFNLVLRRSQRTRWNKEQGLSLPPPAINAVLHLPQGVEHHETPASSSASPVKAVVTKRRYTWLALILLIILLAALIPFAFARIFPSTPVGIGIINKSNNEQIGLSDGTYVFDAGTDRVDAPLKIQAAAKFAQGDKAGAVSLWKQAAQNDTSDAEALIYLEDQQVLASGSPYITLVVATTLTGSQNNISTGRDDLQGTYVAQKEYNKNSKLSGGRQVRLLIANAGSDSDYVTEVAGQIVQAAKQDSTIIGVMGWSFSAYAQTAIPVLASAHIPMVSSTASADSLSGVSPYFFRVVPPNRSQAVAGALYAEQQLHAKKVALFVDSRNSYSSSLADGFKQQFVSDGNQIVATEAYTVGDKASLPALLQSALNSNPDLIYFAGYADDLAVLLVNFPTSQPNLQVLGGDGLYEPSAYPSSAKPGFSRVHFTAFTYPDEWNILGKNEPSFFSEYPADFNPAHVDHSANPYGFTRAADSAVLSYDATYALLQGCQNVLDAKNTLTAASLQRGLTQITGAKAIQGVSGQISFGHNGDPINKAIVILYVDQEGHIHLLEKDGIQGCFIVGQCG
jgi:predicted HTH transcriptional regulator/ABC-type branched-subunit amino acid transport system substrate-binding protein